MSVKTNIKIITDTGEQLDYTTPESLNIKLNRIADDYTDPKVRMGEFSYTLSLPKTKNNERILQFPSAYNKKGRFNVNPISISLFNNDAILMSGQLELRTVQEDSYECVFYSTLTQLIDSLEDVNLQDVTMPQIENWDYETTMRTHMNADYQNSDEADYQFPLVYYSTYFTPFSTYDGLTDAFGYGFRDEGDRAMQNHYYLLNRTQTGSDGERYFHEFPLCFYLKTVLEKTLGHVGWNLSGSFWEREDIKKIIMLYSGENDVYDSGYYTGTTSPDNLDTSVFMPDYKAKDFISDIISTFNLFLSIDLNNKILSFETYDTVFNSKVNPYNIDNKIFKESIKIRNIEDSDISISLKDPENIQILGDNYFMDGSSTNGLTVDYKKTTDGIFPNVYNHVGTTSGEIKVGFAAPSVKRLYLRNTDNYAGSVTSANDSVIYVPNMSKQTRTDNANKVFNSSTGDTAAYNEEEFIDFKQSKPMLMYYYGLSDSDIIQQTGKGSSSDYFYFDFDNTKQKIGFASPFAYKSYRTNINSELDNPESDVSASYASYLQSVYMMMGTGYTFQPDFSLVFGDSHNLADTLYTELYGNRMNRYINSEVLSANIRMSDYDWSYMTFNQPLKYNNEIYSLMSIKNYDIVSGVAQIELIKQI